MKEPTVSKVTEAAESKAPAAPPAIPQNLAEGAAQQQQLKIDETNVFASYANFARVTGTPEEVIVDLGLNPQPFGVPTEPVKINQRIVLNFYTAKRLLVALHMTLQRHEEAFGVLETDVQKRVNTNVGRVR
jgi:hypothetical protein